VINLLLILLCGTRFISPEVGKYQHVLVCEGDSNTSYYVSIGQSWPDQLFILINNYIDYRVRNVATGGEQLPQMITDAPTHIDPYFQTAGICFLLGGINDTVVGGASNDTVYARTKTFCDARRAAGWTMVIMTYPNATMSVVNDSIQANWVTFADDIVDLAEAPCIGEAADHYDPVYFVDAIHMTVAGYAIIADSVYKHVQILI